MECLKERPNLSGLLDILEQHVRRNLNFRSILMLLGVLIGCVLLFGCRRQLLKPFPDGHFPYISHQQLHDFIRDPARPVANLWRGDMKLTAGPVQAAHLQRPAISGTDLARRGQVYYAVTEATVDVAFPFVYGTFLGILLWLIFGHQRRWTLLFPLAIVSWDLVENSTMICYSLAFAYCPAVDEVPVWATWPTSIKWGSAVLTLLLIGYGLVKKLPGGRRVVAIAPA